MKQLIPGILLTIAFGALATETQAQEPLRGMSGDWAILFTHSTITILLVLVFLVLAGVIRNLTNSKRIIELIRAKRKNLPIWLTVIGLGLAGSASAQGLGGLSFTMTEDLTWAFVIADVVLIFFIFIEIALIRRILKMASLEEENQIQENPDITFAGIKLTDTVPIERESELLTDHEYDGIRELDNNLPPWWVYGFYFCIFFAFAYIFYYHVYDGPSQAEEYTTEMADAKIEVENYVSKLANRVDESNVARLEDESSLNFGKTIYMENCTACHGDLGEGGVGPTFADVNWIHGGGIVNIFSTIKYGVPEKGMISWESQLSPSEMQQVASYIMGFEGTNPPGMKAPQGDPYK